MASGKPADKPNDKTAQHGGEDRETGKLPPGSGLDRRQDRNTEGTGKTAGNGPHPKKPDHSNP